MAMSISNLKERYRRRLVKNNTKQSRTDSAGFVLVDAILNEIRYMVRNPLCFLNELRFSHRFTHRTLRSAMHLLRIRMILSRSKFEINESATYEAIKMPLPKSKFKANLKRCVGTLIRNFQSKVERIGKQAAQVGGRKKRQQSHPCGLQLAENKHIFNFTPLAEKNLVEQRRSRRQQRHFGQSTKTLL